MGTSFIIFGVVAIVVGIVLSNHAPGPTEPKSNDLRVVKRADDLFEVQRYVDWPTWVLLKDGFSSAEEAQALIDRIGRAPEVVSTRTQRMAGAP